jgi:hypothetical protein
VTRSAMWKGQRHGLQGDLGPLSGTSVLIFMIDDAVSQQNNNSAAWEETAEGPFSFHFT